MGGGPVIHYQKGSPKFLLIDLTSVMIFGETCPLAERGYYAEDCTHRQIKLAVRVSKFDHQPLEHAIYHGNTNSIATVEELIPRLADFAIRDGTVIWDRGDTSHHTITTIERHGWKIMCGVPKSSKDARSIVATTEVPTLPGSLVPCKKSGDLYATKVTAHLFGKTRDVVVYLNIHKATRCLSERNRAIHEASLDLNRLQKTLKPMKKEELEKKLKMVLEDVSKYFLVNFIGTDDACRFDWVIDQELVNLAKHLDGNTCYMHRILRLMQRMLFRCICKKTMSRKHSGFLKPMRRFVTSGTGSNAGSGFI
jgi:transposase